VLVVLAPELPVVAFEVEPLPDEPSREPASWAPRSTTDESPQAATNKERETNRRKLIDALACVGA